MGQRRHATWQQGPPTEGTCLRLGRNRELDGRVGSAAKKSDKTMGATAPISAAGQKEQEVQDGRKEEEEGREGGKGEEEEGGSDAAEAGSGDVYLASPAVALSIDAPQRTCQTSFR